MSAPYYPKPATQRREAPSINHDHEKFAEAIGAYGDAVASGEISNRRSREMRERAAMNEVCDQASLQAPLSAEIRDRLADLIQMLDEVDNDLHGFRQRMFGPWPEAAGLSPGGVLDVEGKLPTADMLIRLLDTAAGRARSVMQHTRIVTSAI